MSPEELEDLAYQGLPLPEGMKSQAQILLYLSFRSLYDFAKRVQMDPEQGKREKEEILYAFRINSFIEDLGNEQQNQWRRIERAAAAYAKEPTLEHADALYYSLYRVSRNPTPEEIERLPFRVVKEN